MDSMDSSSDFTSEAEIDEIDSVSQSPPAFSPPADPSIGNIRPKRSQKPSTKLRNNAENIKAALLDLSSKFSNQFCRYNYSQLLCMVITVVSSFRGCYCEVHKAQLSELSTEGGEALTLEHLKKSSKLMLRYKRKDYAVQFVHFKGTYLLANVCSLCVLFLSDDYDKENKDKNGPRKQKRQQEKEVEGLPRQKDTSKATLGILTNALKKRKTVETVDSTAVLSDKVIRA